MSQTQESTEARLAALLIACPHHWTKSKSSSGKPFWLWFTHQKMPWCLSSFGFSRGGFQMEAICLSCVWEEWLLTMEKLSNNGSINYCILELLLEKQQLISLHFWVFLLYTLSICNHCYSQQIWRLDYFWGLYKRSYSIFFLMNAGRELGFNYHCHLFTIRNRLKKTENGKNSYWELVHTQKDYLSKHILSEKC